MGSLSEKQLFIVVLIVAVLVSGGFGFLSYMEFQKIEEKKVEIDQVQQEIERYRAKERKIVGLESDLQILRAKNLDNKKALPEYRFDDALLKGIQAQATAADVQITSVDPEKEGAAGRARAPAGSNPWESYKFTLNVEGYFFNLLKFVNYLEHYPRLLSVKQGKLTVNSQSSRQTTKKAATTEKTEKEKEEEKSKDTVGPPMQMQIVLEAYMVKAAPAAAPPRPQPAPAAQAGKAPQQGAPPPKPAPAPAPAPEAPKAIPQGDVYKVNEDFKIPEEDLIQTENRRNPFVIWLEPKIVEPDGEGKKGVEVGRDRELIEKVLKKWQEALDALTIMQAQRDKPEEVYFTWKALVEEINNTKLPHPWSLKREEILQSLLAEPFRNQILSEYDAFLEDFARKIRFKMENAFHIGMPDEVCASFVELFKKILAGDRLPPRVRKEMGACMDIFLKVLSQMVEEEGEYRFVLEKIAEIKKIVPEEWKQKPFIKEFMEKMEEYNAKAQALMEFFSMEILVSGMVWLPDDVGAKRVAIVNDHAILEGEALDLQPKGVKRAPGVVEGQKFPVTLERVGRDRFVWFGYKGLKIKYPLGKKPKKEGGR